MESRIMREVSATAIEGYKPSDLTIKDLQEVNFWMNTFETVIDVTVFNYPDNDVSEEVGKILASVAEHIKDKLYLAMEAEVRDILISFIDNYDEEE